MKYLLIAGLLICGCMVAAAQEIGDKTATTLEYSPLENSLSGDPLYVRSVNGSAKIISKDEFERILETDQVSYVQHITDPSSIFIYGDKGKNGVILIVMKGDSFSSKYPGRKRRQR
jgi:hypothetical protein